MSFGADWTCSCGWGNLDARRRCRHCGKNNPEVALATPPAPSPVEQESYQTRVGSACSVLFDGDATDISERRDRFAEEALETCQAFGMTREDMHALVDYTFSRPVGEPGKEIGAAVTTLAALCVYSGYDVMACAEADLTKLQQPETIARIRAKRATRHGRGALPGLSAPTPAPAPAASGEVVPYDLGNCLRGYFSGKFSDDDAAWAALSDQFNRRFPSREGRQVELRKRVRLGTTAGGNETEQDRKLREQLDRLNAEDAALATPAKAGEERA